METITDRELTIAERKARYAVKYVSGGERAVAAELVDYSRGGNAGKLVELARDLWPVAYTHFDDIHHGRFVAGQSVGLENKQVKSVYTLAGQQVTADILNKEWVEVKKERPSVTLAKRKGHGWGNYPIVKGGAHALGSQAVWKVKAGDSVALRTLLPTTPEHKAIIRKCNQILAEAESQNLYFLEVNNQTAARLKKAWGKRKTARWAPFPQHFGRVVMVHSDAAEGGNELGAMCDGYGKAELFALVEGWVANQPAGKRVVPCKGWGLRYKMAKGHTEESLAHAEEQATAVANGQSGATFSTTFPHSPHTIASAWASTVSEEGHGIDCTTSVKADLETLIELGLTKGLKPKAHANLERIESILQNNQKETKVHISPPPVRHYVP